MEKRNPDALVKALRRHILRAKAVLLESIPAEEGHDNRQGRSDSFP